MRPYLLGFCLSCVMLMAAATDLSDMGCKPAETAILDLGAAECALLAQQPNEPIDEVFVCDVFDAAANIIQTFTVKVPAAKAAAFQADHPVKAEHPLPAGAMKR